MTLSTSSHIFRVIHYTVIFGGNCSSFSYAKNAKFTTHSLNLSHFRSICRFYKDRCLSVHFKFLKTFHACLLPFEDSHIVIPIDLTIKMSYFLNEIN